MAPRWWRSAASRRSTSIAPRLGWSCGMNGSGRGSASRSPSACSAPPRPAASIDSSLTRCGTTPSSAKSSNMSATSSRARPATGERVDLLVPSPPLAGCATAPSRRTQRSHPARALDLHEDPIVARLRKSVGKRDDGGSAARMVPRAWTPAISRQAISIAAIGADPDGCTCANTRRSRRMNTRVARHAHVQLEVARRLALASSTRNVKQRQLLVRERLAVADPDHPSAVRLASPATRCRRRSSGTSLRSRRCRATPSPFPKCRWRARVGEELVPPGGHRRQRAVRTCRSRSRRGCRCHSRSSAGDTMKRCIRMAVVGHEVVEPAAAQSSRDR